MSDPAELQKLVNRAKYFIFVTQIHFCSMYAIVVWDWITSLKRERTHIWKARWTTVKGLYLFCRYWVLCIVPYLLWCFTVDHTFETCQRIFKSPIGIAMWNQAAVEAILLLRTYAFFNRNKYVLVGLLAMLAGVLTYQLDVIIQHMFLREVFPDVAFIEGDTGPCFPRSREGEAHILGFFVAPLAFDSIITIMTVGKAVYMRARHGASSHIIQVFLREGLFYYLLISIVNLINGIFYFQPEADMSAIMIPLTVMLGPILACRLILDIRERATDPVITASISAASSGSRRVVQLNKHRNNPGALSYDAGNIGVATEIELGDVDTKLGGSYRSYDLGSSNGIRVDIERGVEVR
ncbi:hypothetical protein OF83DRAFT_1289573 [Amylostereum chailletii]|nr:hypothetical protein OF83DRAFT_1289573 [Amylostereum chailletii]